MQEKLLLENLPSELLFFILFLSGDSRYFLRFARLSTTMKFKINANSNNGHNSYWFQLCLRERLLPINDGTKYNPSLSYRTLYQENADKFKEQNAKLTKDQRELFRCIKANDLTTIARLESSLLDNLDALNHQNRTPVYVASLYGRNEILHFFYDQICTKVFSNAIKDSNGRTKFYWASACKMVSYITSNSDSVIINKAKDNGATPLFVAAENGHLEVVQILIDAGANKEAANDHGATPMFVAAENGHVEVVQTLIDAGANKEAAINHGVTPMFVAAQNGEVDVVQILIDAGANKEAATNHGVTPMFVAALNGKVDVVQILIDAGANKNKATRHKETPLFVAAQNGHVGVVQALIKAGANKNTADDCGETPLFVAAQNGHLEVVQALIKAGADKDITDDYGDTPLTIAKAEMQQKVFEFLAMWNASQLPHKNIPRKIISILEENITLDNIALAAIKKAKTWFFSNAPLTLLIRELNEKSVNQNDVSKENLIALIKSKRTIIPQEKYDFILKNIFEDTDNRLELDSQKSLSSFTH
ncbi:MAG: ankyrin repeat domain-containing protein [Gammaproteobacteria bacterium]|nr:ankyrin repeat domain-containing protein [Gammaproteobacteria bacterium]